MQLLALQQTGLTRMLLLLALLRLQLCSWVDALCLST
jgi:hypothetical protein